jgi:hypothetical protein
MKKTFGSIAAALALTFAGAVAAPSEAEARENCSFRFGNNGVSVNCNLGNGNRGGFNSNGGFYGHHHGVPRQPHYDPRRDWERQQRQCDNMARNYYAARERLYYQGRDGFSHDERRQLQRMEDNMARRGCYLR